MIRALLALVLWSTLAIPAQAVNPDEVLADPVLEARARELSKGLRCVVCQNQSIDDSDATLARDLRVLVRDRLTAGDSDQQVLDYVVSRYGDFVLLKPPFKMSTLVLWIGPLLIAGLALFAGFSFFRRQRPVVQQTNQSATLSSADRKRLEQLLKDDPS
jgi:cytochrome c-type biogenesis protein CcmH